MLPEEEGAPSLRRSPLQGDRTNAVETRGLEEAVLKTTHVSHDVNHMQNIHSERSIAPLVAAVQFISVIEPVMVMPIGPDFASNIGIPTS
ncbi:MULTISPECIES: hypothetical protein [Sorangium]|uniref:hypothetical protein n=1 Tax=Sorangium TaxID=39643 RepID=UPI003D9C505B